MRWRSLTTTTEPTEEPVRLSDARAHVRLDEGDPDEAYFETLLTVARQSVENRTGRALMTQTIDVTFDNWPGSRLLMIPRPPLASVVHVKYIDTAGVEQTLDASRYTVRTADVPGVIQLDYDDTWPTIRPEAGAIRVQAVVGWASRAAVPQALRHAVTLLAATLYEHREQFVVGTIVSSMPPTVAMMCDQYRVRWG